MIAVLSLILITMLFSGGAQKNHAASVVNNDFDRLQSDVKTVNDKYEYIVKNFEIQNNTILYVSAVLGSMLALVIFYFGWKAQKVENEYENVRRDRDRFREQYDNTITEFNSKLTQLKAIEVDIINTKEEIENDKENIKKLIESFVLEYTEDYISKNMEHIIENKAQRTNENTADDINQKFEDVSNHLKILESLQHVSNPQILYKKIDILFTSKKYSDVTRIIESIIDDDNFNKDYLFKYAFALNETGRIDEAFDNYNKHLEVKPNENAVFNNLGVIHKKRKETDKAIVFFEKALDSSKKLLYLSNLADCYDDVNLKIAIYKKHWDSMVNDKEFISDYKELIESNFCINEIYDFCKSAYDNSNTVETYLNLLESSILARNNNKYDELIRLKDQYNFNAKDNIAFKLLLTVNQCLNGDYRINELNDIDIILEGSPSLDFTWNFNLLDRIIPRLEEGEVKGKIFNIISRLNEIKNLRSTKKEV